MDIHLIDGTYELFRYYFAVPAASDVNGQEVGAVRGVLNSVLSMIELGATHIGVATDHVVESFRNDLYPGYKTSEGVPPELLSQFPILAQAAAPSTDADALIPIHPGAATYYNGNQQSFLDKYDDKLYYASLLLGSLISILLAAWRFAGSGAGPQSMLQPLYELGDEIRNAKSESELDDIEKRIDEILDKINQQGYRFLTDEEKEILKRAADEEDL